MKKICLPLFIALLPVLLTGCFLQAQPYNEVIYYDLSTVRLNMPENLPVAIDMFQSSETTRAQMTYLTSDNRIQIDPYNRWVQQPEYLITRYLQTAFSTNQPSIQESAGFRRSMINGIQISGTVFSMRIDLKRREAILGINYMIRSLSGSEHTATLSNSVVFTAKYRNESPSDFAAAMSEAAEKLALQIQNEIYTLQNRKGNDNHVQTDAATANKTVD